MELNYRKQQYRNKKRKKKKTNNNKKKLVEKTISIKQLTNQQRDRNTDGWMDYTEKQINKNTDNTV